MRETFEQLSSSKEYAKVQGSILKKTSWDILMSLRDVPSHCMPCAGVENKSRWGLIVANLDTSKMIRSTVQKIGFGSWVLPNNWWFSGSMFIYQRVSIYIYRPWKYQCSYIHVYRYLSIDESSKSGDPGWLFPGKSDTLTLLETKLEVEAGHGTHGVRGQFEASSHKDFSGI
jgi:hypothetical protein